MDNAPKETANSDTVIDTVAAQANRAAQEKGYPDAKGAGYLSRMDGWQNFFTGVGVAGVDRRLSTTYQGKKPLPQQVLRSIYRADGLGKKIIELPTKAMTRGAYTVTGDPKKMVRARLQETGMLKARRNLVRWSRLYGGALGVVGVDDGQRYEKPLNEDGIRNVHYMHVFNRWRVTFASSDLYKDPQNPNYGLPEFYRVTPIQGQPFVVHETRTVRMDGAPVDDIAQWENWGWGDSMLLALFEALRQVGAVFGSSESIIEDFVQATLSLKDLSAMIGRGEEAKVIKRLEIMDKARHVINANLLDADKETYQKISSSVAGLPDLLDRHINRLCAEAGIPVTVLMGESPAGLNATGDSDVRNWYDSVDDERQENLYAIDHRITRWIFKSKDYFFKGKEPENWDIVYPPLWTPSAKEQAELDKVKSDELVELVDRNVVDPNEARELPDWKDRFGLKGPLEPPPMPPDPADGEGGDPADAGNGESPPEDTPPATTPAAEVVTKPKAKAKKKGAAGDAR